MTLESARSCRAQRIDGRGQLEVRVVDGLSAATSVEAHAPLKLLVPRPRGESVWAYVSNFGGGLLPGDALDVSATIGDSARCFLGTQSSTKIFRAGPKGAVTNRFSATVGVDATLVFAPDVAQSFAASCYRQQQTIHLTNASSSLVFLDWYSSGRSARGERWAFSEYRSKTEIHIADRLTFLDSIHLTAADEPTPLTERMGRANCVATLVILGAPLEDHAHALMAEISALPIQKRASVLLVASPLKNGVVIRAVGDSVELVAREIFSRLGFVASLLGDNVFQRKW